MSAQPPIIEKGVPMATSSRLRLGYWDYLLSMEVGDSVLVTGKPIRRFHGNTQYLRRKRPEWKWATRTVEGGYRVWRIQ